MKMRLETDLPEDLEELIRKVIGAAIDVHRQLGPGFIESIYEQALCYELDLREIKYERQKEIVIPYKQIKLIGQRLDMLVEGQILLELKAIEQIAPIHEAQLLSYLKSTGLRAGLIINFNVKQLKYGIKRIVV
jgi:GxxExxY protein